MSSIYFQITSTGYKRTDRQPPSNLQNNRHLPVYMTVNEFMDLPNKQQTQNKNRNEQESFALGSNLDGNNQKDQKQLGKIKFVAINTSQQYNSLKKDDFDNEERKAQKSLTMSQRYPKLTAIPNPSNIHLKQYTSDAKTQKSTVNLQEPQYSSVYYELQKEKTLRHNLEKSYRSLLQKLEKNETSSKEDQEGWNLDEFIRKQKRHSTQQPMTEKLNKCEFKELDLNSDTQGLFNQRHKNMRSSCCNFKQLELDDQTKKQDIDLEEQNIHLVTQNELVHSKIQEDMQFLKNKLVEVQNKMLLVQLHQKEQELHNIKKEAFEAKPSYNSEKHHLPNRQRIHYLFTILVMFLCMAIMSKK